MNQSPRILAFVLAGGEGRRLRPLTANCSKPAVRFSGTYRIIDFVLANLVNSQISPVYVLAQYKPHALLDYLTRSWQPYWPIQARLPQAGQAFAGTADAVYHNLDLVEHYRPDLVAVFAADHVYRMDVRQMARFHASRGADVTVAAVRVPVENASQFGIMDVDSSGAIQSFQEKPTVPRLRFGNSCSVYASMGNYLFRPATLCALLERTIAIGGSDFGSHVLPTLPGSGCHALAYDFSSNKVPGVRRYEEPAYWRDVGTLYALNQARADTVGLRPRFDLRNPLWPLRPVSAIDDLAERPLLRGAPWYSTNEGGHLCRSKEAIARSNADCECRSTGTEAAVLAN